MIEYVTGDLLKSDCDVIAHGVNCSGGFASGVAGQIAKVFPLAKDRYQRKYHDDGWFLGDVQFNTMPWSGVIIANCATQRDYGRDGKVYVDYDAIANVMRKLLTYSVTNDFSIAIPKIGAGLAGGDWEVIEQIINSVFDAREIYVYVKEDV